MIRDHPEPRIAEDDPRPPLRRPARVLAPVMQPADLLSDALTDREADPSAEHRVRWRDGSTAALDVGRWLADPPPEELDLLAEASGPVLDVGCGPGRHVAALGARGVEALGIDVLPEALRVARRRGADVLQRSAFGDVPRAGEWATVLLLDGNVGIGGDPVALLRRVRELLAPDGAVLVELEGPGVGLQRVEARLETPRGHSARFPWGRVGVDALDLLGEGTGFAVAGVRRAAGRWFAWLTPAG